ncbi:MAG TPA: hypothetical protein VGQ46_08230 [Thermoanaerobaculia bacterium]|nr:hypothetical protein [Thermoanaerobaculia bacterium]
MIPTWVSWVFSGIGVFLLAGVVAVFNRVRARKQPSNELHKLALVNVSAVPASPPATPIISDQSLTLDSVIERLEEAPLLQRADVLRHLLGLPFRFTGELTRAERTEQGKISMILGQIDAVSIAAVTFEVDPTEYPGLGLLRSGHEVTVAGTISNVFQSLVFVENAAVTFQLPP